MRKLDSKVHVGSNYFWILVCDKEENGCDLMLKILIFYSLFFILYAKVRFIGTCSQTIHQKSLDLRHA